VVLCMHVYAYNKTAEFNDAVAHEFGNQINQSNQQNSSFANSIANSVNESQRMPPFPPDHRRVDREFVSSAQHRASWIFGILMTVSAIGVVLPIVAGIMLHRLSSARAIAQAQESALSVLTTADEKRIIKLLQSKGGALTQSELVIETGLTKVKVHRVIVRLQSLGLVEKHAYGMTNKIVLSSDLQSDLQSE